MPKHKPKILKQRSWGAPHKVEVILHLTEDDIKVLKMMFDMCEDKIYSKNEDEPHLSSAIAYGGNYKVNTQTIFETLKREII